MTGDNMVEFNSADVTTDPRVAQLFAVTSQMESEVAELMTRNWIEGMSAKGMAGIFAVAVGQVIGKMAMVHHMLDKDGAALIEQVVQTTRSNAQLALQELKRKPPAGGAAPPLG